MYFAYILYSAQLDRFYVGMTQSVERRVRQHRRTGSHWTARADDWGEVWHAAVEDTRAARVLEKRIKAHGAKRYLQDIGVGVPPEAG